jgi:predicted O-methyltransferase YrrM
MNDRPLRPLVVTELRSAAEQIDFTMSGDERTRMPTRDTGRSTAGRALAGTRHRAGEGTAWLLSGMPADARLVSVESNADYQAIATTLLVRRRP